MLATLIAVLLATAASVLIERTRAVHLASGEARRLEQARLQAEALSAAALVALDSGGALSLNGSEWRPPSELGAGRVRLQGASGLVDLNAATPEQVAALLAALGVEADRASALADRIADWRDPDDLRRLLGAEAPEYLAEGLAPPANQPFEQETEIVRVLGVTQALADCAAPYLTVHSGSGAITPTFAPPMVRGAFPQAAPTQGTLTAAPIGQAVLIIAEAPISPRAVFRLTRWVRLTGDPERPALVHRARAELAPADNEPSSSCAGV